MIRACIAIIVVITALPQAEAQRLDGCPSSDGTTAQEQSVKAISRVPSEARVLALLKAGYTLNKDSVTSALSDTRPDVRSLAAEQFVATWQVKVLNPVAQAMAAETDTCTRVIMQSALSGLASVLARDIAQLPAEHQRVKPFQACTPSDPAIIALRVEDASSSYGHPVVTVSMRNMTSQPLAFVLTKSIEELFSVTVLDPAGKHARIPDSQRALYEPPSRGAVISGSEPTFLPLPPLEEFSWTWSVANDFDMSAAGIWLVSLGAKIPYLNTTVCSNVAYVVVK